MVQLQAEPFGEQALPHQVHLLFGCSVQHLRDDVVSFGVKPAGTVDLVLFNVVRDHEHAFQRRVGPGNLARVRCSGTSASRSKEDWCARRSWLRQLDRCHLKRRTWHGLRDGECASESQQTSSHGGGRHYEYNYRRTGGVMSSALKFLLVCMILCGSASAQGLVTQRVLSLGMAKTIAEATISECKVKGFHTAAVVVDRGGQVLVFLRDEQAAPQVGEMARRKAFTARMFRSTTLEFQKRTISDPTVAPQRDVADILALGGGVPIQIGNEIIGGVGSAGSNQDQDDACAKAGVAKVADLLKPEAGS